MGAVRTEPGAQPRWRRWPDSCTRRPSAAMRRPRRFSRSAAAGTGANWSRPRTARWPFRPRSALPVSYSGGVFGIGALVTGPFASALQAAGAALRSGRAALCTRDRRGALRRQVLRPGARSPAALERLSTQSGRTRRRGLRSAPRSASVQSGQLRLGRANWRWPCSRSAPRWRRRAPRACRPSGRTK